MSPSDAKKIAKKYAEMLRINKIAFTNVYLFGSYAHGKARPDSDIDVAIIANKTGSGKKYLDKKMRLWELTPNVDVRIEPILIEKKDFEKGATTLSYEVQKYGIKVK
ncbi:nucleotidyltransferase domain-containing protein [Candidatus Peregrinibacteria bacterium]|nr:nucleotidyltransferase domain-containing protein [Candidatus Peregrinibacteria bacterium]